MDTKKYEKIVQEVEDLKNGLEAKSATLNEVLWRMRNATSNIKDYLDEIEKIKTEADPREDNERKIQEYESFIETNERMLNAYARIAKSIEKA